MASQIFPLGHWQREVLLTSSLLGPDYLHHDACIILAPQGCTSQVMLSTMVSDAAGVAI